MMQRNNQRTYPATGTQNLPIGIHRPSSTTERLIIDFVPYTCCLGTPDVINDEDIARIPRSVAQAGVSEIDWQRHMKYIREATQQHSVSIMAQLWLKGTVFCMYYPMLKAMKANDAVRIAVENFNHEVLEKHGLYAKTQKAVHGFGRSRQEITWLVIALTQAESRILREEPHLYRYNVLLTELVPAPDGFCCESNEVCGIPVVM